MCNFKNLKLRLKLHPIDVGTVRRKLFESLRAHKTNTAWATRQEYRFNDPYLFLPVLPLLISNAGDVSF